MIVFSIIIPSLIVFKMVEGANILAIFPFTARSHFTMFESLLIELHRNGHNLTVVSHFPLKDQLDNYTDISLIGVTKSLNSNMSLSKIKNFGLIDNLNLLYEQIGDYEPIFKVPKIKNLIKGNHSFDLVITEVFNTDMFLVFPQKFKCPNVAMSASPLMPWAYSRAGLSIQPFIMPLIFSDRTYPMSFFSAVGNTIEWFIALFYYKYIMNPESERIIKKYFTEMTSLEKIASETSLVLVNTHFSLHPLLESKKLIEVGGIHIKDPMPLEKELEQFLNSSVDGAIIFSMGSMFRAETIPKEIFDIFVNVFSKLRQNILWKWESGKYPNIKNIKFMKWLPQRDVLGHPNVKLFIYHGGLLGTSEAIYSGVPILGFPQFGDMAHNIALLGDAGMALSLVSLTEESLTTAIRELLHNPRYKKKALQLSTLYQDRPEHPLSKAVYWIEYVIRHNGTTHIHQPPSEVDDLIITLAVLLSFSCFPLVLILVMFRYFRPTDERFKKMKNV